MSKVLTLAGLSVLVVALVLGMAVPALAAPKAPSLGGDFEGEVVRGEVISIGDQEFVIQSGEEEITIAVDEDTRYCQMPGPERVMALVRQRLQIRQQDCEQLKARLENVPGQGLKKRVRAAVAACRQLKLQSRIAQMERALLPRLYCLKGQAEFGDIAVGDSVVVLVDENNLAQRVLIIEPTA